MCRSSLENVIRIDNDLSDIKMLEIRTKVIPFVYKSLLELGMQLNVPG